MKKISKQLDTQLVFLKNYLNLLTEVEKAIHYVSECYKNDDDDIGDRLLKNVMNGLIDYNEENMTMQSIFNNDDVAKNALTKFQVVVRSAMKLEEDVENKQEKIQFLHESLLPKEQNWKTIVEHYIGAVDQF